MARQLFGTDGIRGMAGEFPLDPRTIESLGFAFANQSKLRSIEGDILIGGDTRESTPWIAERIARGVMKAGRTPRFAGVLTSAGVAYLARSEPFAAGVAITAFHNPYQDNGIKIFSHSGFKIPDEDELEIEREIFVELDRPHVERPPVELVLDATAGAKYINYLCSTIATTLGGMHVVLDCANGSASNFAPDVFQRLGASLSVINATPNGKNINLNSGSLHVDQLRAKVAELRADCGVAFDGDARRALFVGPSGALIDGDHVLLAISRALHKAGILPGAVCIATVMSNIGLERALAADGIGLIRTAVGDKYVLEEMIRRGAVVGGEQSGQIIFRNFATTGDGILTALQFLAVARESGSDIEALVKDLVVYPQLLLNVKLKARKPLADLPTVLEELHRVEDELGDRGRVLVRFSGTEPLARVMVEGPDLARLRNAADRIAEAIREALN